MTCISLILVFIGFFKKNSIFIVLGGIILLITGAYFMQGINYVNGYTITDNGTVTIINATITSFQTQNTTFSNAFSIAYYLLGLGFIFFGIYYIFSRKDKSYDGDVFEDEE